VPHWYAFYPADYARDTGDLTMVEHGAYRLLMDHYYSSGGPLSTDVDRVLRLCRATVEAEAAAVRFILAKFFALGDDGYHHRGRYFPTRHGRVTRPDGGRKMPGYWRRLRVWVLQRDNFTCQYCQETPDRLECDHVVPVSRGGSDEPDNLVAACKPCNASKKDKLISEWGGR
jgi:hypothetical protein